MGRPFNFAEGEFYHIYNRGTEKRDIFHTDANYDRFKTLLFLSNGAHAVNLEGDGSTIAHVRHIERGDPLVAVGAYCLMPNHFHLLLKETSRGGISKFMQKVSTGYTMYFNKLNDRTGSLFQGRFKAKHAAEDQYLKYLFAYIHLNPAKIVDPHWKERELRHDVREYVEQYNHSSYPDYRGDERAESAILSRKEFPNYFDSAEEFAKEMNEWLNFAEAEQ